MRRLFLQNDWPETWKCSYFYDLQEIYGTVQHHGYTYAYATRRKQTLDLIEEFLPKGAKILDVAAAQGNFTLSLAELGYEVTWNDLRTELADYVRLKHEKGTVHFAPGNVFELGFEADFDCVLITEIIEHVAHPDEFLRKVATMIKPDGCIVMSTPNGAYFRNKLPKFSECADPSIYEKDQFKPNSDGHIFLLWPEEIAELGDYAGLKLLRHIVFTNPLTAGQIKLEHLLKVLPYRLVIKIEQLSGLLPVFLKNMVCTSSCSLFLKEPPIAPNS